jgi:hypothetical protein
MQNGGGSQRRRDLTLADHSNACEGNQRDDRVALCAGPDYDSPNDSNTARVRCSMRPLNLLARPRRFWIGIGHGYVHARQGMGLGVVKLVSAAQTGADIVALDHAIEQASLTPDGARKGARPRTAPSTHVTNSRRRPAPITSSAPNGTSATATAAGSSPLPGF